MHPNEVLLVVRHHTQSFGPSRDFSWVAAEVELRSEPAYREAFQEQIARQVAILSGYTDGKPQEA